MDIWDRPRLRRIHRLTLELQLPCSTREALDLAAKKARIFKLSLSLKIERWFDEIHDLEFITILQYYYTRMTSTWGAHLLVNFLQFINYRVARKPGIDFNSRAKWFQLSRWRYILIFKNRRASGFFINDFFKLNLGQLRAECRSVFLVQSTSNLT